MDENPTCVEKKDDEGGDRGVAEKRKIRSGQWEKKKEYLTKGSAQVRFHRKRGTWNEKLRPNPTKKNLASAKKKKEPQKKRVGSNKGGLKGAVARKFAPPTKPKK